jgi:L-asparaginase / beta-aspartyl-peptidase
MDFSFAIHGGAGTILSMVKGDELCVQYERALMEIISKVYAYAKQDANRSAVDIAEHAVNLLENERLFNAGLGAVFTTDETHELEASIMDGSNHKCGAASLLRRVKNPITLARVMIHHPAHIWITGESAQKFAVENKVELVESNSYFSTNYRLVQLQKAKELSQVCNDHDTNTTPIKHPVPEPEGMPPQPVPFLASDVPAGEGIAGLDIEDFHTETVGCVCMRGGHVCAATSTGGMTNKVSGRVGDTPVIGAGTYASDKTCAVSATGRGECQ